MGAHGSIRPRGATRSPRRAAVAVAVCLLGALPVCADEIAAPLERAVCAVLEAHTAADEAEMARLASRDEPDPWRVAHGLLARGAADAAAAFAHAAPRPDVASLGAWVTKRREAADAPGAADPFHRASAAREDGLALRGQGRSKESIAALRTAAQEAETLGWLALASRCLRDAGRVAFSSDDFETARDLWARRLAVDGRRGVDVDRAETLRDLGLVQRTLGAYAEALTNLDRALALHRRCQARDEVVADLDLVARAHLEMGDTVEALAFQKRALAMLDAGEVSATHARLLRRLGAIHAALRQEDAGLEVLEEALAASVALGDAAGAGAAHADMGDIRLALGEHDAALALYERSLAAYRGIEDASGMARALAGLGGVHRARGDARGALSYQEQALALYERAGTRRQAIVALASMALTRGYLGDSAGALALYERARAEAERVRVQDLLVRSLWGSAEAHLLDGAEEKAAAGARCAIAGLPGVLGGLSEEQGAAARAQHAGIFEVGAMAAVGLGSDELVCFFLESGRAGTLLEFLGRREALQAALVSPELLEAEAAARQSEAEALEAYRRVRDVGGRRQIRLARAALDASRYQLKAVIERIQREAKGKVGVFTQPPADLEAIRGWVGEGEVLVLFGLFSEEAIALVVRSSGAHTVRLGKTAAIVRVFRGFLLDDPEESPDEVLRALQTLVVAPLGLTEADRRVLVSPDGLLAYAPFAPLLGDREVVYVPSATTYGLLLADREARGEGVLALGDPVYDTNEDPCVTASTRSGVDLLPLPYTRDEAVAVGTVVLLGSEATEAGFRYSVAKRERWRAVHIACHGVMDPDHPTLSALALTTDGKDDGFLTALDVFRLRIPADLVVLSACDSGVGKIVNAEGVLGLMRAFLFAGAPRVVVSLGRVDDAATRVLMEELYGQWQAGKPAATALRLAQGAVRSRPGWEHPHYWANWVLWGLPD